MKLPRRRTGFRRKATVIALATAAVAVVLVLFGVQSVQRIQAVEDRWAEYSLNAAEAGRLLNNISQQMGYGGFIHNFKNYILRRDDDYLTALDHNRDAVYANLKGLERYVISEEEKAAVDQIRKVFDWYAAGIPIATEAFRRGLSSVEVDVLVKVNDEPALVAIAQLNHSFLTRTRLAEREINKAMEAASSMVWVLLAVVPVVVLLGVVLILFLRRIIDANLKLAEVSDELAMLLRQAPDVILHVASDGRIVRANDRALVLFGYTRDELLGKYIEDLIPNRYRQAHVGIRSDAFEKMSSRPIGKGAALYAATKDGQEIPVDISLNFSLSGGKRIATAIIRDVTERKRAEDELQRAHDELEERVKERTQELEDQINERRRAETQLVQSAKMATIGEMASGITHELNQPMNIMRMGVEAAQIRIQRGQADMELMSDTLQRVESQILRMSDIINHMRIYSRQDVEDHVCFNPLHAVRDGCSLFTGQLSGIDVELKAILPEENNTCAIVGHATRLEQVLLNLLSNARDAILSRQEQNDGVPSGWIQVSMTVDEDNTKLTIIVEDNGGGIADDVLPHIFAPFVTTKESGSGTGLGLSISYGIVEGMGGTIEAVNTEEGARFELTFALVDADECKETPPTIRSRDGLRRPESAGDKHTENNQTKVLVVDDEMNAAHSLADFLQDMGYLVYTAYNGAEAIQIFTSDPTDAVITDLRMPVMDGEELILQLRGLSQSLPIFAMTGHVPADKDETRMVQGATEVWRKPLSLNEIAQRLQAACEPAAPQD